MVSLTLYVLKCGQNEAKYIKSFKAEKNLNVALILGKY